MSTRFRFGRFPILAFLLFLFLTGGVSFALVGHYLVYPLIRTKDKQLNCICCGENLIDKFNKSRVSKLKNVEGCGDKKTVPVAYAVKGYSLNKEEAKVVLSISDKTAQTKTYMDYTTQQGKSVNKSHSDALSLAFDFAINLGNFNKLTMDKIVNYYSDSYTKNKEIIEKAYKASMNFNGVLGVKGKTLRDVIKNDFRWKHIAGEGDNDGIVRYLFGEFGDISGFYCRECIMGRYLSLYIYELAEETYVPSAEEQKGNMHEVNNIYTECVICACERSEDDEKEIEKHAGELCCSVCHNIVGHLECLNRWHEYESKSKKKKKKKTCPMCRSEWKPLNIEITGPIPTIKRLEENGRPIAYLYDPSLNEVCYWCHGEGGTYLKRLDPSKTNNRHVIGAYIKDFAHKKFTADFINIPFKDDPPFGAGLRFHFGTGTDGCSYVGFHNTEYTNEGIKYEGESIWGTDYVFSDEYLEEKPENITLGNIQADEEIVNADKKRAESEKKKK